MAFKDQPQGSGSRHANSAKKPYSPTPSNTNTTPSSGLDESLAQAITHYRHELEKLKDVFGNSWSDADLVSILEEAGGDLDLAISRISEGHAEQWGEVKTSKKKDKQAKVSKGAQDGVPAVHGRGGSRFQGEPRLQGPPGRGGRGGGIAGRGGRGGGRGGRGGRGGSANGYNRPPRQQYLNGIQAQPTTTPDWPETAPEEAGEWGAATDSAADSKTVTDALQSLSVEEAPKAPAAAKAWGPKKEAVSQPAQPVAAAAPKTEKKAPGAPATSWANKSGAPVQKPSTGANGVSQARAAQAVQPPKTSWAQIVKVPEPQPVAQSTPAPAEPVHAKTGSPKPKASQPAPGAQEAKPAAHPPRPASPPKEKSTTPVPKETVEASKAAAQTSRPSSPSKQPPAPVQKPVQQTTQQTRAPATQQTPVATAQAVQQLAASIQQIGAASSAAQSQQRQQQQQSSASSSPRQPATLASSDVSTASTPAAAAPVARPAPPGLKQSRPQTTRKLKQDAAVVMPSNANLTLPGVRFGSLSIGGVSSGSPTEQPEEPQSKAPAPAVPTVTKASVTSAAPQVSLAASTLSSTASPISSAKPATTAVSEPVQVSAGPTALPTSSITSTTTAPSTHANQPPAVVANPRLPAVTSMMPPMAPVALQQLAAGFGIGHMGSLPTEYSALYGSDPQARAVMGYYASADPNTYNQGGLSAKYPGQDTASVASAQTAPQQPQQPQQQPQQPTVGASMQQPSHQQQQLQQQSQQQLQQAPNQNAAAAAQQTPQTYPLPAAAYYYPYYLPNQFPSAYQSSVYGQPFVNKSLYPAFPGAPAQASTPQGPAAASANKTSGLSGNTAAAYGYSGVAGQPHLAYHHHHQGVGYDDLSSGLGHAAGAGAQDYSKTGAGAGGAGVVNSGVGVGGMYGIPGAGHTGGFQGFGIGGNTTGVGQVASAKGPGNPSVQASPQQAGNRPPRQSYDSHKYQQNPTGNQGPGPQGSAGSGASVGAGGAGSVGNPGVAAGAGTNPAAAAAAYYGQHQQFGLHHAAAAGYPHMMHQQQYSATNLPYGNQQRQQYWSGNQ
ncbi:RNAPII degradation factor [Quaeritorhiza haematococci]|nr:RNAPII degradation factor [Quaeritorhiza haematococci]